MSLAKMSRNDTMDHFQKLWTTLAKFGPPILLAIRDRKVNTFEVIKRDKRIPYCFSIRNTRPSRIEGFFFDAYKIPRASPVSSHALESVFSLGNPSVHFLFLNYLDDHQKKRRNILKPLFLNWLIREDHRTTSFVNVFYF